MQVWNVLRAALWKYRTQKSRHKSPSGHHRTTLSGYIFATKAYIDNWGKNLLSSNISSTCPHNMVNFGALVSEIGPVVWGPPANFNRFRVLAALLHGTVVVGVGQTLRHWTAGATYIRQGGHHVGHWPTFLVQFILLLSIAVSALALLVVCPEERLACNKLSDEMLTWLYVCSEVQVICIWSSWCHCHSIISCFIKIQNGFFTFLVLSYPGCPGKEAVKCFFLFFLPSVAFGGLVWIAISLFVNLSLCLLSARKHKRRVRHKTDMRVARVICNLINSFEDKDFRFQVLMTEWLLSPGCEVYMHLALTWWPSFSKLPKNDDAVFV